MQCEVCNEPAEFTCRDCVDDMQLCPSCFDEVHEGHSRQPVHSSVAAVVEDKVVKPSVILEGAGSVESSRVPEVTKPLEIEVNSESPPNPPRESISILNEVNVEAENLVVENKEIISHRPSVTSVQERVVNENKRLSLSSNIDSPKLPEAPIERSLSNDLRLSTSSRSREFGERQSTMVSTIEKQENKGKHNQRRRSSNVQHLESEALHHVQKEDSLIASSHSQVVADALAYERGLKTSYINNETFSNHQKELMEKMQEQSVNHINHLEQTARDLENRVQILLESRFAQSEVEARESRKKINELQSSLNTQGGKLALLVAENDKLRRALEKSAIAGSGTAAVALATELSVSHQKNDQMAENVSDDGGLKNLAPADRKLLSKADMQKTRDELLSEIAFLRRTLMGKDSSFRRLVRYKEWEYALHDQTRRQDHIIAINDAYNSAFSSAQQALYQAIQSKDREPPSSENPDISDRDIYVRLRPILSLLLAQSRSTSHEIIAASVARTQLLESQARFLRGLLLRLPPRVAGTLAPEIADFQQLMNLSKSSKETSFSSQAEVNHNLRSTSGIIGESPRFRQWLSIAAETDEKKSGKTGSRSASSFQPEFAPGRSDPRQNRNEMRMLMGMERNSINLDEVDDMHLGSIGIDPDKHRDLKSLSVSDRTNRESQDSLSRSKKQNENGLSRALESGMINTAPIGSKLHSKSAQRKSQNNDAYVSNKTNESLKGNRGFIGLTSNETALLRLKTAPNQNHLPDLYDSEEEMEFDNNHAMAFESPRDFDNNDILNIYASNKNLSDVDGIAVTAFGNRARQKPRNISNNFVNEERICNPPMKK